MKCGFVDFVVGVMVGGEIGDDRVVVILWLVIRIFFEVCVCLGEVDNLIGSDGSWVGSRLIIVVVDYIWGSCIEDGVFVWSREILVDRVGDSRSI